MVFDLPPSPPLPLQGNRHVQFRDQRNSVRCRWAKWRRRVLRIPYRQHRRRRRRRHLHLDQSGGPKPAACSWRRRWCRLLAVARPSIMQLLLPTGTFPTISCLKTLRHQQLQPSLTGDCLFLCLSAPSGLFPSANSPDVQARTRIVARVRISTRRSLGTRVSNLLFTVVFACVDFSRCRLAHSLVLSLRSSSIPLRRPDQQWWLRG